MKIAVCFLFLIHYFGLSALAANKNDSLYSPSYYNFLKNQLQLIPCQLPIAVNNKFNAANCVNSTFYMHVTSPGSKIVLKQIQGLLDGSFFAVGELINISGLKEGFIIRLDNDGNYLSQNLLRINNSPVSIQDVRINSQGALTMGGILQNSNSVFIAQLSNMLSTNWVNTFVFASVPLKVSLHILDQENYGLAVQTQSSVVCFQLSPNGSTQWTKEIISGGLIKLLGFSTMVAGGNGVVTSNFRNGKNETEVTSISTSGNVVSTHIIGNGIDENKGLEISSSSLRMTVLCIKRNSSANFNIVRNRLNSSGNVETEHIYQVAGNYNFNTSAAISNGSEAIGLCMPQDGKLLFLKQFAGSQTTVEFSKQYNVPHGSQIVGLTRAYDGGYLFGLNSADSSQLLFIKTDSIGIVSGCNYQNLPITSVESSNMPNTPSFITNNPVLLPAISGTGSLTSSVFNSSFDCRQNYCPPAPLADTCQATYYKNMISGGYSHLLGSGFLMRGDNLLFGFNRGDNILENINTLRYGLKLYDENAHFIKGIYLDEQYPNSTSYLIKQVSDSTILYFTLTFINAEMYLTFRVFSDNLNLISQHTYKAPPGLQNAGGYTIGDVHIDQEGNYYLCRTSDGALGLEPKLTVFKVSPTGLPLWVKRYSIIGGGYLLNVSMTSTSSSLIFVLEGGNTGSVSARIDKLTGQMLNAYIYQNSGGSGLVRRFLQYDQGHIFYAGRNGNSKYTMGFFDSTGRPYKMKYIDEASGSNGGQIRNEKFYTSVQNTNFTADFMLQIDTGLNIISANRYDNFNSGSTMVNSSGFIYSKGIYSHGPNNNYYDPFFRKYDPNGKLGLCASISFTPTVVNINNLNVTPLSFSLISTGSLTAVAPLLTTISPDFYGHAVSSIICSTPPTCSMIGVTGPVSVCQLNVDYTYPYFHNAGCNLLPQVIADPNIVQVRNITDTTIVLSFLNIGSVSIKAILNSGCSKFADSIQVQIQSGGSFTLGPDKFLCTGDTLILNAGNGFSSYSWQDGTIGNTFAVTHGGQYYVEVGNSCGELLTDTIFVTESIIPSLTLGNDRTVCKRNTILLTATPGFASYSWLPAPQVTGNGLQVQTIPLQDEQITLHAITNQGCNAYDTINIYIKQERVINLGNDTSFCAMDSVIVTAGTGYTQYAWSNSNTTNTIVVNSPGSYSVAATDVNGCLARDTLVVQNLYSLPSLDLGPDFSLCVNENRILDAGNFSNFLWQDNTNTRFYSARTVGKYVVKVTDQQGCSVKDSIQIKNIFPLPKSFIIGPDSICTYEKIELKTGTAMGSYLWSNGSTQPTITITTPGIYMIAATDKNGCKGKDTIKIFQKNCIVGLFIPNAFTPNGDAKNDVFKAQVFGIVDGFKLEVFNRYGQLMFVTSDPKKGWDGKFKGLDQKDGAYVWQCHYQLNGKAQTIENGTVILIR